MSLFDPQPKKEPYDLYGREKELTALVDDLKNKRWVVLLGPRRVGKTSLAQCAAKRTIRQTSVDECSKDRSHHPLHRRIGPDGGACAGARRPLAAMSERLTGLAPGGSAGTE